MPSRMAPRVDFHHWQLREITYIVFELYCNIFSPFLIVFLCDIDFSENVKSTQTRLK